jgi:hypothetical protein
MSEDDRQELGRGVGMHLRKPILIKPLNKASETAMLGYFREQHLGEFG